MDEREITFYFDFISPYSYLALTQAADFSRQHGIGWRLCPVVFAKLLDATGLDGPAENEIKRQYMMADILRCAHRLDVPLVGPPAHPFRSLDALRAQCLFNHDSQAVGVAIAMATAAWGLGRDLCDWEVIFEVVMGLGSASSLGQVKDAKDLKEKCESPDNKELLFSYTKEAIDAGVFGVPTFRLGSELFWGHDRMLHLGEHLSGNLPGMQKASQDLIRRPRGAERRGGRSST